MAVDEADGQVGYLGYFLTGGIWTGLEPRRSKTSQERQKPLSNNRKDVENLPHVVNPWRIIYSAVVTKLSSYFA